MAEVVVEGGRGAGVAELVGDVTDAEAGVVQVGRDGLAEGVAAHPRVAGEVQGGAQVGLGVGGVAQLAGGPFPVWWTRVVVAPSDRESEHGFDASCVHG